MRKTYTGYITHLEKNQVFIYGSNPEGRHGKGTAAIAHKKYGAKWGKGRGLYGQSYGIVTTDLRIAGRPNVSQEKIIGEILGLYDVAKQNPDKEYLIAYTADGQNLSGYTSKEIATMFGSAFNIPQNIVFEDKFWELVEHFNDLFLED